MVTCTQQNPAPQLGIISANADEQSLHRTNPITSALFFAVFTGED